MPNPLDQRLSSELLKRREQHLYRSRKIVSSAQEAEIVIDGKPCLSFCSNDYLGLANHPEVIKAFKQGAEQYGVGSGASHLVTGHTQAHHELENELADAVQRPRTLLFSTGYMANLGVMSALLDDSDAVFEDRLNHASLIDAGLISHATLKRYQHTDLDSLKSMLEKTNANNTLIATDGVFSMDGDIAPLPAMASLARQHNSYLMIDDAHGFGVIGKDGMGTASYHQLSQDDAPIIMCTLGKALGTFGAFVAGSEELIETLIQNARTYIYTTALPAAVAEATRASLKLSQQEAWRRQKLDTLIARFKQGAHQLDLTLLPSNTPIQPLLVNDPERALRLSHALFKHGIYITAIRPPTVPQDSSRLRITFSAHHTETHIDQLLSALDTLRV